MEEIEEAGGCGNSRVGNSIGLFLTYGFLTCGFFNLRFLTCGVASYEFGLEFAEAILADGLTGFFHEAEIKVEVMEGEDALGNDFSGAEAVAEEGAREASDVGVGVSGEGGGVELELLIFDVNGAIWGEGLAVTSAAGGVNAVEHIDSLGDHLEKLGGRAEAHGVARFILGEEGFGILDRGEHLFFRLADRDSADGIAVEIEVDELAGGKLTEVRIDGALHNAEMKLATVSRGGLVGFDPVLAALSPAGCESGGVFRVFALAGIGGAFVKKHRDVGSESGLNFHAFLWAEHHAGAIEVALELDTFLADFADFREGPDLEAAGICEHGAIPGGEGVESAKLLDDLGAGPEPEVVGVPEDDLSIHHDEIVWVEGFDGSLRANGHEDGGLDHAVRSGEAASPGLGARISMKEFEHGRARELA